MPPGPDYREPFHWWGPGWDTPPRLGVVDLLRNGTVDCISGAILWAAMQRRWSTVVIGGPSGIGKSTTLAAMLEFLPVLTSPVYVRGRYETFAFLDDRSITPDRTILLINEISPHLPIYAWGGQIERLLNLTARGYQLAATAHATSPTELVGLLARSPLRIPATSVARFTLVVHLDYAEGPPSGRTIRHIWQMRSTGHGVRYEALYPELPSDISQEDPRHTPVPHPFSTTEMAKRQMLLEELRSGKREKLPSSERSGTPDE